MGYLYIRTSSWCLDLKDCKREFANRVTIFYFIQINQAVIVCIDRISEEQMLID